MAVITPAVETSNAKLIDPGIKKYFYDVFKELAPKLDRVFKVQSSSEAYEEYSAYAGLGVVPKVEEGATYAEDAVLATYTTTLTHSKYGFLVPVSHELYDDQREKIAGKTQAAARALARKIESLASSVYIHGFNTSYTSYGDAVPLFSTAHTRADGGSNQSNASATGITLTDANLETGLLAMRTQLDDRGNLKDIVPSKLIVPPALEKEAIVITKSDKVSGKADNDVNPYAMTTYTGGMLDVVVWDYLGAAAGGSDTAWYLMDNSSHLVTWLWRDQPRIVMLDEAVGAKNDIWYWKARFRAAYGWADWRGVWGSRGDGAAYAS
jgi:phage major head subunit gpT-like protein